MPRRPRSRNPATASLRRGARKARLRREGNVVFGVDDFAAPGATPRFGDAHRRLFQCPADEDLFLIFASVRLRPAPSRLAVDLLEANPSGRKTGQPRDRRRDVTALACCGRRARLQSAAPRRQGQDAFKETFAAARWTMPRRSRGSSGSASRSRSSWKSRPASFECT